MKRLFFTCMALLAILSCHAIDIDYSNNGKIAAGLKLGASLYPSFDVEIGLEYRPLRYVGANVGLLLIMPINRRGDVVEELPMINSEYREIKSYQECFYRTAVRAGLQFTTPAVMLTEGEMGLSLRFSGGIIMPFPTNKRVKVLHGQEIEIIYDEEYEVEQENYFIDSEEYFDNSGAKFCYWYGRAEMVLEYEENWEFSIGYTHSNFDLYGGSRNIVINDTPIITADKKPMHNFMLGLTYKF